MLSEGRPGIDNLFSLQDGMFSLATLSFLDSVVSMRQIYTDHDTIPMSSYDHSLCNANNSPSQVS